MLGHGCVQEEIRFSLCPEMLVSLLICEVMEPNECVVLVGCQRYSTYDGYARSFRFTGNFQDQAPRYLIQIENDLFIYSFAFIW